MHTAGMQELEFAHSCLADDAKNYHAWSHRQAVVRLAELWESELLYTSDVIEDDVRNNSAWSQRFFVLSARPSRSCLHGSLLDRGILLARSMLA